MTSKETDPELENLLDYIQANRGFDFRNYKRTSLSRRIRKRMQFLDIETYSNFLDYLEVHPEEFINLFNTILINVTTFFRDPEAWQFIANEIMPRIVAQKHISKPIRVWSAGCASGEETYSLALLLAEALGMEQYLSRVKVFATDVDVDALNHARQANYGIKDVNHVPQNLLEKYFEEVNGRYTLQKELRRCVIFGRHDLVQDAPISRIDLLICRNTLMYFNTESQSKILDQFHFALNDTGFLFLGKAEMLFTRNHFFTPTDLRCRVFTKISHSNLRDTLSNMVHLQNKQPAIEMVDQIRIYEAAFEIDPIAQIVLDINNSVLLANSQAKILFNINPRDLGRPLQDLELSYRPVELRSLIEQVYASRRTITLKDIEWFKSERELRYFDIQILPLLNDNTDTLLGVKIVFDDVTRFKQLQDDLVNTNQELETAYEELQSTVEELETTNEELQSTVEELETTNEELQSTNEELETMNEELQSTNEELQSINEELRQRSDELNTVNTFFESILTSLRAGVVVLGSDLHIMIWNRRAEDLWGLHSNEVVSQDFFSLDIGLPLEPLKQPIQAIIAKECQSHEVLLEARNRRGKAILCQIICTPLIAIGSEIQGIILLMEEREQTD